MVSRDDSLWVAFHVSTDEHPKVEPLTDAAFREWFKLVTYSRRQNLNGRIPKARWLKIRQKVRNELVKIQPGQENPLAYDLGEEGAEVHDYLDWQPSATEIANAKQAASTGGTFGNHRRWHINRNVIDPECRYCRPNRSADRGSDRSPDQSGESLREIGG